MDTAELARGAIIDGWGEGTEHVEFSTTTSVIDPSTPPILEQTGCPGRDVCTVMSSKVGKTSMTFLLPENCAQCIGADITGNTGGNYAA